MLTMVPLKYEYVWKLIFLHALKLLGVKNNLLKDLE
jgi:hypothetical protein